MLNPELRDHLVDTMRGLPKEELIRWAIKAIEGFFNAIDENAGHKAGERITGRRKTDRE